MRPKILTTVVLARGLLAVLGLSYVQAATIPTSLALFVLVPFVVFQLVVLWALSGGYNWARIAAITLAFLTIPSLGSLRAHDLPQQVLLTIDVVFSAWLIYWLTRPSVRFYFQPPHPAA